MEFHERLREARLKAGMTQKEVGEACGIQEANYRKYELGKYLPNLSLACKIADALNVSLDWLCGR